MPRRACCLLSCALLAGSAFAQVRIDRVVVPGQAPLLSESPDADADGVPVQMFESTSLDRYLRKAQEFLQREDFVGAIRLLQDVVEGRTRQEVVGEDEGQRPQAETDEIDPSRAVFSSDQRLFRPVRHLCHELLAALPEAAQTLYREQFEVEAQRAFEGAFAARDVRALESVHERYFVTLAAGRALLAAADLQLDAGSLRAALQSYRRLLERYPEALRAKLPEVDPIAIRVRIALCHQWIGEAARARELLAGLAAEHPRGSVRLLGELHAVADLSGSRWFAAPELARRAPPPDGAAATFDPGDPLLPLWELRFATPNPYRGARAPNQNQRVVQIQVEGSGAGVPLTTQYSPGTHVAFAGDELLVMDHFRLKALDLLTGRHRLVGDGPDLMPEPRQGVARGRVPSYDWLAHRVVTAGELRLAIQHRSRRPQTGLRPLLENELVATDAGGQERWSSQAWEGGEPGGTTILAAPVVHAGLVLVPIQHDGAVLLAGAELATGRLVFRTPLHAGGTELARVPAAPAIVAAGIAYVATHAGVVAAVDAGSGALLWARRYERTHPLRAADPAQRRRARQSGNRIAGAPGGREVSLLRGFAPAELHVVDGRVIVAPLDGQVLLCLDGASGEILWLASKPANASIQQIVGYDRERLYVSGAKLTCIEHRTGIRLWEVDQPVPNWSGRGVVGDDLILLPAQREVYWLRPSSVPTSARATGDWRRVPLPALAVGNPPFEGPCNLFLHGPILIAAYEAGLEAYGAWPVLRATAAAGDRDGFARTLAVGGDLVGASEQLVRLLEQAGAEPPAEPLWRLLRISREIALAMAAHGVREPALASLDVLRPWLDARLADAPLRSHWHFARLEVLRALEDEAGVAAETSALYRVGLPR